MAVHKPGKALGKSIALKSAQKGLQGRSSRAAYASLNLTAMVDMFTLLTVFLLANFSATGEILFMSKDIDLPEADATAQLERAPVVSISKRAVALEGEQVALTDELMRPEVHDVADLTVRLQDLKKAQEMMRPGEFKGTIIVQCDAAIEFNVVRKVMYAAAEAGYIDVNHAVLSKGGLPIPGQEGAEPPAGEAPTAPN
jgi:biopolymer transport protein ExbD